LNLVPKIIAIHPPLSYLIVPLWNAPERIKLKKLTHGFTNISWAVLTPTKAKTGHEPKDAILEDF
jgi:hypothetical protein